MTFLCRRNSRRLPALMAAAASVRPSRKWAPGWRLLKSPTQPALSFVLPSLHVSMLLSLSFRDSASAAEPFSPGAVGKSLLDCHRTLRSYFQPGRTHFHPQPPSLSLCHLSLSLSLSLFLSFPPCFVLFRLPPPHMSTIVVVVVVIVILVGTVGVLFSFTEDGKKGGQPHLSTRKRRMHLLRRGQWHSRFGVRTFEAMWFAIHCMLGWPLGPIFIVYVSFPNNTSIMSIGFWLYQMLGESSLASFPNSPKRASTLATAVSREVQDQIPRSSAQLLNILIMLIDLRRTRGMSTCQIATEKTIYQATRNWLG